MSAQYTIAISSELSNLNLSSSLSSSTRSMISKESSQIKALTSRLAPLDITAQSSIESLFVKKPVFGDARSVLCWLRGVRKSLASAVAFDQYKQAAADGIAESRNQFLF